MAERHTGWLPTPAETIERLHAEGVIKFADEHPLLKAAKPSADFEDIDCRHLFIVEDQNGTNMCTGGSGAQTIGGAFKKEGFNVRFCPASVYAPICGGRDQGANLGECLEALTKYGAWPAGYGGIDQFDWRSAYRTRFWQNPDSEAAKEAAKYKILESVFCNTLDEWLAGIQSGAWAGQFAIGALGRHFPSGLVLEPDESLLSFDGTGINHAQTATGGMRRNKAGVLEIQGLNPWGADWGSGGFYWLDPVDWLDPRTHRGQELWLCRTTSIPTES